MTTRQPLRGIGVFSDRQHTEAALTALQKARFPMQQVSILAKDSSNHPDVLNQIKTRDAASEKAEAGSKTGAVAGTVLGGLGGLLIGISTIAVPGVGPFIAAGSLGTLLATTLAGSGIGAISGEIVGAFVGLGVPDQQATVYGDRLSQGSDLIMVEGSQAQLHRAEAILSTHSIQEWGVY
jgi:hypothetical protein